MYHRLDFTEIYRSVQYSAFPVTDAFLTCGVIQENTGNIVVSVVLFKHRNINFILVEATFV